MRPQSKKQFFEKSGKQLFAKACARRRVAFAKSCFYAAFSSGSFAIFLCAFFYWFLICFRLGVRNYLPPGVGFCVPDHIGPEKIHINMRTVFGAPCQGHRPGRRFWCPPATLFSVLVLIFSILLLHFFQFG
jgi:hypothetical protein